MFALGCVLFQCLTGVPPFDGDTTAAILAKILFGTAPRVSELWPEVPESLDALVAQMLAKEPALRPSDGANLAAALAALGPLAHTALMAPRERAASPRATTTGERRLLAVVMLGPPGRDDRAARGPAAARGRPLRRPPRAARRRLHGRDARRRSPGRDRSGRPGRALRARDVRARRRIAPWRSRWAAPSRAAGCPKAT